MALTDEQYFEDEMREEALNDSEASDNYAECERCHVGMSEWEYDVNGGLCSECLALNEEVLDGYL